MKKANFLMVEKFDSQSLRSSWPFSGLYFILFSPTLGAINTAGSSRVLLVKHHHPPAVTAMSENKMGFHGFHAWRANQQPTAGQTHMRPTLGVPHDPVKLPCACDVSANCGGARRSGFPSSMFRRGDADGLLEGTLITDGGWVRPSPAGWALPPEQPLELSDENSRRSTTSSDGGGLARRWSSGPALQLFKKAPSAETIDSSEAARKYGGRFTVTG